jgi:hypothetical protein
MYEIEFVTRTLKRCSKVSNSENTIHKEIHVENGFRKLDHSHRYRKLENPINNGTNDFDEFGKGSVSGGHYPFYP